MVVVPDDPWSAYARMVVSIQLPDREAVVLRAAATGKTGHWPWPTDATVYILTAWNPGATRLGLEENRRRQRQLESELAGLPGLRWAAHGVDPVTGARDEGVAVVGVSEHEVLAVAGRYGQDAVFAWSPQAWTIVACTDDRRLSSGWVTELTD